MTGGEQAERAFNLGLAAVLGEGVYNFGELVSVTSPDAPVAAAAVRGGEGRGSVKSVWNYG